MDRLFKSFLEDYIDFEYSNEKFDSSFNCCSSKEVFTNEYKKFLGLYNCFFYSNRFLTSINSNEVYLKEDILRHLFVLYDYATKNNFTDEEIILLEFLVTYYNTINSKEYRGNCENNYNIKCQFKNILNEFSFSASFFSDGINKIFDFYNKVLQYGIDNDIFVSKELLERIFNNLNAFKKKEYYDALVDLMIRSKKELRFVIVYDNNKKKNIKTYFAEICRYLDSFGGYNYAKNMIYELDKDECLSSDLSNKIMNKYIVIVNNICRKLCVKDDSFIQSLALIDYTLQELNFILQNVESFSKKHKSKIRECLSYLLSLKRYLISDLDYANSEMQEYVYEHDIPKEEIDKTREEMKKNVFSLYGASKVKFSKSVGEAINLYSKYPLSSLVNSFRIDSLSQIYFKNVENSMSKKNVFKSYYDIIGEHYSLSHPKLKNRLTSGYYEELLRYLSKTFISQQNLILSILGKNDFDTIINTLKESVSYDFQNDYAVIVSNILSIEADVVLLLKKFKLPVDKDGLENLCTLFEYFDDDFKKDGLMYLNYILYEKSGLNLRNSVMHGKEINTDLNVSLLTTFSGLIFISWLLNEK